MCFSGMELIEKWWLSHEDKQVLESKDVSKGKKKKKASISIHTTGEGGGYFSVQGDKPCLSEAVNTEVFAYDVCS